MRLHRLLYSRSTQDGKVYDKESLEPLFVPGSRFLTEGPSYQQAIALLDKFLKEQHDQAIKDPLSARSCSAISGLSSPRRSRTPSSFFEATDIATISSISTDSRTPAMARSRRISVPGGAHSRSGWWR